METKHLSLAVMATLVLSAGCKKEEVKEPDLGYAYFPTKVGAWVEYQVDSLWRDDRAGIRDSVSYRLRERIMEHFTDLQGRPSQRIHRFVLDEQGQWVVRDVWAATMDAYAAERTEENYRRLKLSFPIRPGRTWDINIYGTGAAQDPQDDDELMVGYEEIDEPWSNSSLSFERTVLVKNTVPANFVVKRNFEERYADGVGMVNKYWEETNTQTVQQPGGNYVVEVKGWRLRMTAVDHGVD